jgi:hypothetical protein
MSWAGVVKYGAQILVGKTTASNSQNTRKQEVGQPHTNANQPKGTQISGKQSTIVEQKTDVATNQGQAREEPRSIAVEWYCRSPEDSMNKTLIEQTSIDIARQHDCTLIAIRSDIHNTTSALASVPMQPPPPAPRPTSRYVRGSPSPWNGNGSSPIPDGPWRSAGPRNSQIQAGLSGWRGSPLNPQSGNCAGARAMPPAPAGYNRGGFSGYNRAPSNGTYQQRGQTSFVPMLAPMKENSAYTLPNPRIVGYPSQPVVYGRTNMQKCFVEAPWHFTVEFKKLDGSWFTAHVYTETIQDGYDEAGVEKFVTKGLSRLEGPIKSNPQLWKQNKPSFKGEHRGRFLVPFDPSKPLTAGKPTGPVPNNAFLRVPTTPTLMAAA